MAVLINCSWCGKTMGTTTIQGIRDWTDGDVCKSCLAKKDATFKAFEAVIEKTKGRADRLMRDAEPMISEAIKQIAEQE